MKSKIKIGMKIGMLTVLEETGKTTSNRCKIYRCRCDCGNIIERDSCSLRHGVTRGFVSSCGCWTPELKNISITTESDNVSGRRGVYYDKDKRRWRARLTIRGKSIHGGRYKTKKEAIAARARLEEEYYDPIMEEFNNKIKEVKAV